MKEEQMNKFAEILRSEPEDDIVMLKKCER